MPIPRKLMDSQRDRQTEGWMERWTDPILKYPSG